MSNMNRVRAAVLLVVSSALASAGGSAPAAPSNLEALVVHELPNPGAPPTASQQAVEVVADAYTEVLIQYDSGIR